MPDPLDALRLPTVPVEPRPEFAAALLRRITGAGEPAAAPPATVRYYVTDLDATVAFYRDLLGFEEELRPSPLFAMLYRGDLRLLLSVPGRVGGGEALPDGSVPAPGGWNRIALRVPDLDAAVAELRRQGARLRTGVITGFAIRQVLLHDPAGNLVELYEPAAGYHERTPPTVAEPPPGRLPSERRESRADRQRTHQPQETTSSPV
jgi:catechol 2,3-dioxygenase-like lactoylglutathione lyase family enzyme